MKKSKQFPRKGTERKPQNSVEEKKEQINHRWCDYKDIFGETHPMSVDGIAKLAAELVQWANTDEEAWKVSQFYLSKNIGVRTWMEWVNKYPVLKDAQDDAKAAIGNRREIGALKNKLSTAIVNYTMPIYDVEWKLESERIAALKKKEEDTKSNFVINLQPIPSSNMVPDRKDE